MIGFIISKRVKLFGFPLLFSLVLIGLLLYHHLENERVLPSDGWSQTIPLVDSDGKSSPFVYQEGDQYHIYTSNKDTLKHLVVDDDLQIKSQTDIPVEIPTTSSFWAKDNDVLFFRNKDIFHFNGQKEEVLLNDIDGFSSDENQIIYWKEKDLYSIDLTTFDSQQVGESKSEIGNVILNRNTSSFLVHSELDLADVKVSLFQKEKQGYQSTDLFQLSKSGPEEFTSIDYIESENELNLMYSTYSTAQQMHTYRSYFAKMSQDQLKEKPDFEEMLFRDKETDEYLRNPRYVNLFLKDNTPTVLFSSSGNKKQREHNLYEAKQKNNHWISNQRSTTSELHMYPENLDQKAITWIDYTGEAHSLVGASKDPDTIRKSKILTAEDWKRATSNTISGLFTGLVILFFALIWVVSPAIFLILTNFVNEDLIDKNTRWVEWTSILIYFVVQVALMPKIFNGSFYAHSPDYLTFSGSVIIIPLVLAIFTYVFLEIGSDSDWGIIGRISYFVGVDLLFVLLLIAPYTL